MCIYLVVSGSETKIGSYIAAELRSLGLGAGCPKRGNAERQWPPEQQQRQSEIINEIVSVSSISARYIIVDVPQQSV